MTKVLQIGVKALIFNGKKILLIKRSAYSGKDLRDLWDIPGGRINLGEEPESGLHREIEEEVGKINFEIVKPIQVKSIVNDEQRQIIRVTYQCKYLDGVVTLSQEHTDSSWFSLSKLPKNLDWLTFEAIESLKGA